MLPEKKFSDIKCIWMESNIVEYKLCDNDFNCETCLFDKAMRNTFHVSSSNNANNQSKAQTLIKKIFGSFESENDKGNTVYLKNHLTVRNLIGNKYYLGISPLANNILMNYTTEHISGKILFEKNDPILIISGEWGKVTVNCPFSLRVVEYFKKNSTWFAIIECEAEDISENSISTHDYNSDVLAISEAFNDLNLNKAEVGATMFDGGSLLSDISKIIGKEKYLQLLKTIFNKI